MGNNDKKNNIEVSHYKPVFVITTKAKSKQNEGNDCIFYRKSFIGIFEVFRTNIYNQFRLDVSPSLYVGSPSH